MSKRSPGSEQFILLLFGPLLISWGAGTTGRWIDLAATPGALLASVPSSAPLLGTLAMIGLAALALRAPTGPIGALVRTLALSLALPVLAALAAVARPLPWVAFGFLAVAWWTRPPDAEAPDPPLSRWEIASLPLLWIACARLRPFGDGLLPPDLHDRVALAIGGSPWIADSLAVLLPLAAAPLLAGPAMRGAKSIGLGAAAALLLVASFGSDQAWVSAAVLGGVIGAYPPRTAADGGRARQVLYLLVICACASGRLALTERWRCGDALEEAPVTQLLQASDVRGLALSSGNLGYLALLADGGATLQRMTVTGALGDRAPLDPPGGLLVSPLVPGGPVVRVVDQGAATLVEWWDIPRLEVTRRRELRLGCAVDRAIDDGAGNLLLGCGTRTVRLSASDETAEPVEIELSGARAREALNRGLLTHRPGALARGEVLGPEGVVASAGLGPFAQDIASGPQRFLVARGPAGHLDVRAAPAAIPSLYDPPEAPDQRVRDALTHRADSTRVGVWPGQVEYSPKRGAAYVSSPVDASVSLVDVDVTWHQATVSIGAPARQVVLEAGSATLYAANRCGVFAVRIPRPDPWE